MQDELGLFVYVHEDHTVHQPLPYQDSGWFISESEGEFHLYDVPLFDDEPVACGVFTTLMQAYNIAGMLK